VRQALTLPNRKSGALTPMVSTLKLVFLDDGADIQANGEDQRTRQAHVMLGTMDYERDGMPYKDQKVAIYHDHLYWPLLLVVRQARKMAIGKPNWKLQSRRSEEAWKPADAAEAAARDCTHPPKVGAT
jgi:hypothetical protein